MRFVSASADALDQTTPNSILLLTDACSMRLMLQGWFEFGPSQTDFREIYIYRMDDSESAPYASIFFEKDHDHMILNQSDHSHLIKLLVSSQMNSDRWSANIKEAVDLINLQYRSTVPKIDIDPAK